MSNFERRFGKYAIPNLATILIACYAVGYVIQFFNSGVLYYLTLNPYQILHGQIWRIVTWILIPPSGGNIFLTLIMLYFYWNIGVLLERTWGTYRYNLYIFSGMLFTVLGSFVSMGLAYLFYYDAWGLSVGEYAARMFNAGSVFFSTSYINTSMFLAFAATFPQMQVLLMFIVPIRVKWLGIVYGVIALWDFITGTKVPQGAFVLDLSVFSRTAILASLLNFIVFYFTSRKHILRSPKQIKRQHAYRREVQRSTNTGTRHKCAICGRTEETNPELEFRFCSKCSGNYEYCSDHLWTHQHFQ